MEGILSTGLALGYPIYFYLQFPILPSLLHSITATKDIKPYKWYMYMETLKSLLLIVNPEEKNGFNEECAIWN